jgi:glycosyltransferase involved in cell wall biosynthesis
MLKVLQINSCINSGSTGRIAEQIGELILQYGGESCVAYARNEQESKSEKIKIGSDFDLYRHVILTRLLDRHGLASGQATKELVRRIRAFQPDIIHLHNIHGYFLNYKILFRYLQSSDIPVVWTLHDCWAFTGHCAYFTAVGCDKWQSGCFRCPQKKVYPKSLLLDRSSKNYLDKKEHFTSVGNIVFVPVSDWLAELLSRSYLGKYPLKRIYNGIDTLVFFPKNNKEAVYYRYRISADFLIVGVAAIWSPQKGLDDFIRLYEQIPENYKILLIGLSEEQTKAIPDGIISIPRTESLSLLVDIYSAADLFINPTREDNFPTVNLEALACGTPVATYSTGGAPEALTPETGFTVLPGDIQGLLDAIDTVRQNGKAFYSKACRKRILEHFKKEDRYREYMQLYREVLKNE